MGIASFASDYMPAPGETCTACVMGYYKRAALLFDRIWIARRTESAEFLDIPPEVTFGLQKVSMGTSMKK